MRIPYIVLAHARKLRIEYLGAIYHVKDRGDRHEDILPSVAFGGESHSSVALGPDEQPSNGAPSQNHWAIFIVSFQV